eukprot:2722634-Pleurochrysis_carterae.AAC.2
MAVASLAVHAEKGSVRAQCGLQQSESLFFGMPTADHFVPQTCAYFQLRALTLRKSRPERVGLEGRPRLLLQEKVWRMRGAQPAGAAFAVCSLHSPERCAAAKRMHAL